MQYDMKWLVPVIFEAFKYLFCKLEGSDHLISQSILQVLKFTMAAGWYI